jgi:hypothetical protein
MIYEYNRMQTVKTAEKLAYKLKFEEFQANFLDPARVFRSSGGSTFNFNF